MKKFFVQELHDNGEVVGSVNTAHEIVTFLGFRDCTNCEYEVYDFSEFGKVVKLEEDANIGWPSNYHRLVNPFTHEIVIEGYSAEH